MKTNSKTSLFLMELIIVILFFSIASVVCVQLFVNAYNTNEATREKSQGTVITQNLSEGLIGCGGDLGVLVELFNSGNQMYAVLDDEAGELSIFYNKDGQETDTSDNAVYTASITVTDSDGNPVITTDDPKLSGSVLNAAVEVCAAGSDRVVAAQEIECYVPFRLETVR